MGHACNSSWPVLFKFPRQTHTHIHKHARVWNGHGLGNLQDARGKMWVVVRRDMREKAIVRANRD